MTAAAEPTEPVERLPWTSGVAPAYIGTFLWIAFLDRIGQRALPIGGLAPAALGLVAGAVLAYLLLYRLPAAWGFASGRPLDGVAAEQFPRGGALTLNTLGGLGMLAVGVLGAPFQGYIQDTKTDRDLAASNQAVHAQVIQDPKTSVFGSYRPVSQDKVDALPEADKAAVTAIQDASKRNVLVTTAIFPCFMLACYLGLLLYFRARGGYKPQIIVSEEEEGRIMAGGTPAPAEF